MLTRSALLLLAGLVSSQAATLKLSPGSATRAASESEANYGACHLFVDEQAGTSLPITVFFDPGTFGVESAEVFTNLNRRDRAGSDADGDGVEDGIKPVNGNTIPAGNDANYYKAYSMSLVSGGYQITLNATKTGAYRLTARYRLNGDAAGTYRWYGDTDGGGKRDYAIIVSPVDARSVRLYEVNVFNVEADGDTFATRSTFEDLHNAPGAPHNGSNRWDLNYLTSLGCNWLWFQPIHPAGVEGRETNPSTGSPYDPGSPYAVKNFFEVNELASKNYNAGNTLAQNRAAAMTAFQNFVAAADAAGVGVMLDAPFNHTGFDCELSQTGIDLWAPSGNPGAWQPYDLIKNREARVYSKDYNPGVTGAVTPSFVDGGENYGQRASNANDIAPAPDRFDFGKWADVKDVFFGRYDALVEYNDGASGAEVTSKTNEGDWFDYSAGSGSFDSVTQGVWRYFAQYALHWLTQTGVPSGSSLAWQSTHGIDGLRADFAQGLPPQCWEYIINKARARKWNFVFMAESLDGGAVTYRSSRHFDILNESTVFALKSAGSTSDYRSLLENRRTAYGQGLVLLNNMSHDEEAFTDPWLGVMRNAVTGTVDGATMIFPGQELGISRTFGYTHYETNFGKQVAHFKRWNSMMPAWNDSDFGNDQLYPVYQGINAARAGSAALRSSNRYFLDQVSGGTHGTIFSVAKYETKNVAPNLSDVVFGFANLDRNNYQSGTFNVNQDTDADGVNDYGIKPGRTYNVKNIAAYGVARRSQWLWGSGTTGSTLLSSGVFVGMNAVPSSAGAWSTAPYEAQYLKLYDVTPPPSPGTPGTVKAYAIGSGATFAFTGVTDAEGGISGYRVIVGSTPGGSDVYNNTVVTTSVTVNGSLGQTLYARVVAVNNAGIESALSSTSPGVVLLDPNGDADGDGMINSHEDLAGTNPLSATSSLRISTAARPSPSSFTVSWASVAGKVYRVQATTDLASVAWADLSGNITASGSSTSYTDTSATPQRKFYRVRLVVP